MPGLETVNLDKMFNIENFKFMDIKHVLKSLIDEMGSMNDRFDLLKDKVGDIQMPDMEKLNEKISNIDKKVDVSDKERKMLDDKFERFKFQTGENFDKVDERIKDERELWKNRVQALEEDVEELKKRPAGSGIVESTGEV